MSRELSCRNAYRNLSRRVFGSNILLISAKCFKPLITIVTPGENSIPLLRIGCNGKRNRCTGAVNKNRVIGLSGDRVKCERRFEFRVFRQSTLPEGLSIVPALGFAKLETLFRRDCRYFARWPDHPTPPRSRG